MRIVFFGTPAFAVPSLRALLDERAEIVAVVTQPDKPHGRSRSTLVAPPVKQLALDHGLAVLQPTRPAGDVFTASIRRLAPAVGIVVAYGHILRPDVLGIPPLGMINVHASLLPRHRGAAPIQHAILAGDAVTGVTIMQMDQGMDTGPILHRLTTPIGPGETAGSLGDRLAQLGAEALLEALALLRLGRLRPQPQQDTLATHAPKIDRVIAHIDWAAEASQIARQTQAFDPAPGAWTTLGGTDVKVFGALPAGSAPPGRRPGTVVETGDSVVVATGEGALRITEVQPAGKVRMPAGDWLRGRGIRVGQFFT